MQRFDIQNDKDVLIEIMLFSLCFPIISKILYKSESTELLNSFDGKYSVFHAFIFYFLHFHKKPGGMSKKLGETRRNCPKTRRKKKLGEIPQN